MLEDNSFEKMINHVFSPKNKEKILLLYDEPTDLIKDNEVWKERRSIVYEWMDSLKKINNRNLSVEVVTFESLGIPNKLLDKNILKEISKYNIVIAFTEFSITSSLVKIIKQNKYYTRAASLPNAQRSTIKTILRTDYDHINKYSHKIKNMLNEAEKAQIFFSTKDELVIDLRNRDAGVDDGDCTHPGKIINLPSGEGFIAPYEAFEDEKDEFGESYTEGILPIFFNNEIIKAQIKNNVIKSFTGSDESVQRINTYFNKGDNRRNIAELGIGCNQQATIIGNVIQDEKVGLHIAYGLSNHIGGKIICDLHYDIVYAKGCPVEAVKVILSNDQDQFTLIDSAELNLQLLDSF